MPMTGESVEQPTFILSWSKNENHESCKTEACGSPAASYWPIQLKTGCLSPEDCKLGFLLRTVPESQMTS